MRRDNESDQHGCWSTPKSAALNISESKKRTIRRSRKKKNEFSSDEFSDSDKSETLEESEMHTPPSSMRIEQEVSTIMNSSGENATLPKPEVQGNETFVVEEEEHSPRSDEAVIVLKAKSKRATRARAKKVVSYYTTKDSSLDSSSMEDYTEIASSSDENLNRTKTHATFATKSNRRSTSKNARGIKIHDSFEDLFNDPIVPNQTFPSAKKKSKPKRVSKKKPRKSEHWSPVPLAYMRGLRNSDKSLKFKSREDKENYMSETAPVPQTLNSRRSAGDSAWRTRTIGSPSQTRTLVRGNKTHTIYKAADDADRTSPSKTGTLVRGSDKTHTIYRASDRTHTIVKGRPIERQKPPESHSELEAVRSKKKKQSKPAVNNLTRLKYILSSESSDLSSSDDDSDESSVDEAMMHKKVKSTSEFAKFLSIAFDEEIKDHLENFPAFIFDPNEYRS